MNRLALTMVSLIIAWMMILPLAYAIIWFVGENVEIFTPFVSGEKQP